VLIVISMIAGLLLLEPLDGTGVWEALARPSRRLRRGERLAGAQLLEPLGEGRWRVQLDGPPAGDVPLPPYITERPEDAERLQPRLFYTSAAVDGPLCVYLRRCRSVKQ